MIEAKGTICFSGVVGHCSVKSMGTASAKGDLLYAWASRPRGAAARLGGPARGRGKVMFSSEINAALRGFVLCFMLLTLLVAGAGLARASVACFDDMADHVTAESNSGEDHMERADRADDTRDCKHTLARMCCAHGGFSGLSAGEAGVVVRIALGLTYALRADPPHVTRAPTPELAPPRFASV